MDKTRGVSARALWEEAVSETMQTDRWHGLDWSRLPSYLQSEFQTDAQKRWQALLEERHRKKLLQDQQQDRALVTDSVDQGSSDQISDGAHLAMQKLLAGVEGPAASSTQDVPAVQNQDDVTSATTSLPTTTSTTEDPEVVKEREEEKQRAAMLQKEVVNKLTEGMAEISAEDARAATEQTSTTTVTTTTTTTNPALAKLLSGVDGSSAPEPISFGGNNQAVDPTTTSTSTSTTTTEDPKVVKEREEQKRKLAMLQTEVVNKLTAGMAEISAEEASAATAQTTTTTDRKSVV